MIRKLRRKFIILALTALFVLLAVIVLGMNLLNYRSVVKDADTTLTILSENGGTFPVVTEGRPWWLPANMSQEILYESRFFSALLATDGEVVYADVSQIYMVDQDTARDYIQTALDDRADGGFVEDFRYMLVTEGQYMRITFLDCGRKLDLFHDFVFQSILIALIGYVVTAVIICVLSHRFVRPVAESYERQKRFITDAGHEIKTPLTIISANVDVLEMDIGENESLSDIRQQTGRLRDLTNDLVYLSRMEEAGGTLPMVDFPLSEVVTDASAPFATLAASQEKELVCGIEPMVSLCGNDKAISRLVSILLDNAVKYSPKGSRIELNLQKQGRHVLLWVGNKCSTPVTEENLRHVFDRFYRTDASRNSETGGHGIGLSMAQAIVNEHGGKIGATSPDGESFVVTASFPG